MKHRLGKIIRTNDKCEECSGFLTFVVNEMNKDVHGNQKFCGFWECAVCHRKMPGEWMRNVSPNAKITTEVSRETVSSYEHQAKIFLNEFE